MARIQAMYIKYSIKYVVFMYSDFWLIHFRTLHTIYPAFN